MGTDRTLIPLRGVVFTDYTVKGPVDEYLEAIGELLPPLTDRYPAIGYELRLHKDKYKDEEITLLKIKVDGDHVDLETHKKTAGFQRIRRITGYLVGTLDRFNDGKLAEVKDRVSHNYGVDYTHTVSGLLDD